MAENGFEYDLVTVGAGSGGTRASRISSQVYGAKVACVELPFDFRASDTHGGAGGTCVIRGCVPKKMLVYGSMFQEEFRDAKGFGWSVNDSNPFNWEALIAKKDKEIRRLNSTYTKILKDAGVHLFEGRASLVDAHTVEVQLTSGGVKRLSTKYILLANGGKPVKADIPGKEHAITSDDALVLDDLPGKSIVVVGAGYISVEFSSIFRGLGADVHLMFRKPLVLTGFDEECRHHVAEDMKSRGIHLHSSTTPTKIEKIGEGDYLVHYEHDGKTGSLSAGLVMFGTGRKPNTHDIGLEDVGVELTERGAVKVDKFSQTSVPNIYAIGDVTDRLALTPVAIMEGMAFSATVFGKKEQPPIYDKVPSACFVQPPLAYAGLTEEQAKRTIAGDIDVYTSFFRPMKNTISGRQEKTFMKLLVDVKTDEVIGAHMVGPDAPEVMQGIAIAMKCNAKKADFDATVGIHPSAAEEFVTMRTRTRRIKGEATGNVACDTHARAGGPMT